jgi:hypothetical protein
MADEYIVESVEEHEGSPAWRIRMRKPDGTYHAHIMPKATLEWRAAEYGITDVDELLDIALHEPFAPPTDAQAALIEGVTRDTGPTLYEATSTADARAAHRARIARAKTERITVRNGNSDPLAVIRWNHYIIDPDRMRAKRELVDERRWRMQYGGLPVESPKEMIRRA